MYRPVALPLLAFLAVSLESKKFTSLSNVIKTRHDAAMSAIRNMK